MRKVYLPFQNQIGNYEDKSTDVPMTSFMSLDVGYYCVWMARGHCTHLCALQLYRSADIYCTLLYSLPFQKVCPPQAHCVF